MTQVDFARKRKLRIVVALRRALCPAGHKGWRLLPVVLLAHPFARAHQMSRLRKLRDWRPREDSNLRPAV